MLSFLQAGDFHLDSPFQGLSPREAAKTREEQRELLLSFPPLVKEQGVDFLLLTGDIWDSTLVFEETILAFEQMLSSVTVPIFIAPGNHDPYDNKSPYQRLRHGSHVHIFKSPKTEAIYLADLGITVYGSAFVEKYRPDSPLENFAVTESSGLHIGCFHGDTSNKNSLYGGISKEQIAASGLDYLALGHIHKRSPLEKEGETFYAYAGTPQGRGFDEMDTKGAYVGKLEKGRVSLDFIPLCHHEYRILTVDITGENPAEALKKALPLEPSPDILRIVLKGERERPLYLPQLHKIASPTCFSLSLEDKTHSPDNLFARAKEENLTGIFLQEIRGEMMTCDDKNLYELALRFGLAALEGGERP